MIDRKPRVLTAAQMDALRALRRTVVDHLELRRLQAKMRLIRIEIGEDYELGYWSRKLGVSRDELRNAVAKVGPVAVDVKAHLHGSRRV